MDHNVQGIMKLLVGSVNSGLNASLTPADCRLLLAVLAKASKKKTNHIDRIVEKFATIATEAIEAFGDDIRKGKL